MCSCETLYSIEAVKGNQLLPGGGWHGDGDWGAGDTGRMFCTVAQAQKELKEIPKETWPDGATALSLIEYWGPDAR